MNHSHRDSQTDMVHTYTKRFVYSVILSVPILLFSPMIQHILGISLDVPGARSILFVLSSILYLYGGRPFLQGLYQEVVHRRPGMMTLVGTAITVAYVYSAAIVFGLPGELFFWELATLVDIMLFGHIIEMKAVQAASRSLEHIAQLLPATAHLIKNDTTDDISVINIRPNDHLLVRPGEKVPADGIIIRGESELNEAFLTGESRPVFKMKDNKVLAGSLNGSGSLVIQVEKEHKDTYIAQVLRLVTEVMESKSYVQDRADKIAYILTLCALIGGTLTFVTWLWLHSSVSYALERMVSVMVTACPHALGLAVPLVIARITGLSAAQGIVIRNRRAFESATNVTTVLFDKTGTLTKGCLEVSDILSFSSLSLNDLLSYAASVERYSEHPIAKALVLKAQEENIPLFSVTSTKAYPGKGTVGYTEKGTVFVGNMRLFKELALELPQKQKAVEEMQRLSLEGKTVVAVASEKAFEGAIALSDTIRPESYEACKTLIKEGFTLALITGDTAGAAHRVAQELGIETVLAQVLPNQKAEKVISLQKQGLKVAMIGDGINDAPALAAADLGIALGAGSDIAQETADIILVLNDPRKVVTIIRLSRITEHKMKQNLFLATIYNVIALPLAAGVLAHYSIIIDPAFGALMMALSTVVVAFNSRIIVTK